MCNKQFQAKKRFDNHTKNSKCNQDSRKCQHCDKVYATISALKLHQTKLNGKKVSSMCAMCAEY